MTPAVAPANQTGTQTNTKAQDLKADLAQAESAAWHGGQTPTQQAANINKINSLREKIKKAEDASAQKSQQAQLGNFENQVWGNTGNRADEFSGLSNTGAPAQATESTAPTEAWDGTSERTENQKAADVGEQPTSWHEHNLNYERSLKLSQIAGTQNDGLVGGGKANHSGINWNDNFDNTIILGNSGFANITSFMVDGPVRIEPVSFTVGYESTKIRVSWYELDGNGRVIPEYRNQQYPNEYSIGGGLLSGPGFLDFAPPYPDHNENGYIFTISRPPQGESHGNPGGVDVKIYTEKNGKPAAKIIKSSIEE